MPGADPTTPLKTFDPAIAPKQAAEMEAEGEREGPVIDNGGDEPALSAERGGGAQARNPAMRLPPD